MPTTHNEKKEKFYIRLEYDGSLLCNDQRKRLAEIVGDGIVTDEEGAELINMKLGHARVNLWRMNHNIPGAWEELQGTDNSDYAELVYVADIQPLPKFSQKAVFATIVVPAILISIAVIAVVVWSI